MESLDDVVKSYFIKFRRAKDKGTLIIMREGALKKAPNDEVAIVKAYLERKTELDIKEFML